MLTSFPYSSTQLTPTIPSFLPSFIHNIPPLHKYTKKKPRPIKKGLVFSQQKGWAKVFWVEVGTIPSTCKVTKYISLGKTDKVTLNSVVSPFFLGFCFSVEIFFFACTTSQKVIPPAVPSQLIPCPPHSRPSPQLSPVPPSCRVFAVGLIAEQNPARQSHPSFLVNTKKTWARVSICIGVCCRLSATRLYCILLFSIVSL